MSLSSLQNYSSGSDVSDHDEEEKDDTKNGPSYSTSSKLLKQNETEQAQKMSKFFELNNEDNDDESSSDEKSAEEYSQENSTENQTKKLPSAIGALNCGNSTSSIFMNPFREADEAEFNLLEHHVKLSERKKVEKPVKKSRLMCKMFRKGRCKMGDQCRFSHVVGSALLARLAEPRTQILQDQTPGSPPPNKFESEPVRYNAREEEIIEDNPLNKKRRIGVTNSLIPPKRAMKLFDEQLASESPWTSKR